jgi:hypothetical protein
MKKYGVTTQLLHAYRLSFGDIPEEYTELAGIRNLEVRADIPKDFQRVWDKLKG